MRISFKLVSQCEENEINIPFCLLYRFFKATHIVKFEVVYISIHDVFNAVNVASCSLGNT